MTATKQFEDRCCLKAYLSRYFRAKEKQTLLQKRLRRLQTELPSAEIQNRIQQQANLERACMLEIMDVLDLLPPESMERTILELRHLDCKSWKEIHRSVYLTRSPCFIYYNKGLDKLLAMPEVRKKLKL